MRITWDIDKKRGNHRPVLRYSIVLEEFERDLAVSSANILSTLPKLDAPHQPHCMPGEHERSPGWKPRDFHWISAPYFRDGIAEGSMRLPFRESGYYPEVEDSFSLLREQHENVIREAYSRSPIQHNGELDLTDKTRNSIAATLTARKMLSFCGV